MRHTICPHCGGTGKLPAESGRKHKTCAHGGEPGKCERCHAEHMAEKDTCTIKGHYCKGPLTLETDGER